MQRTSCAASKPRAFGSACWRSRYPGHTRGSIVFLLNQTYLFTGDSFAWSHERRDLQAFRDACWYSWDELKRSLARLAEYRFEWVLAGHGGSARLPPDEVNERLRALLERM